MAMHWSTYKRRLIYKKGKNVVEVDANYVQFIDIAGIGAMFTGITNQVAVFGKEEVFSILLEALSLLMFLFTLSTMCIFVFSMYSFVVNLVGKNYISGVFIGITGFVIVFLMDRINKFITNTLLVDYPIKKGWNLGK